MLKYNNNYYIITDGTDSCGWLKEGLGYGMVISVISLLSSLSYQDTFTLKNKI